MPCRTVVGSAGQGVQIAGRGLKPLGFTNPTQRTANDHTQARSGFQARLLHGFYGCVDEELRGAAGRQWRHLRRQTRQALDFAAASHAPRLSPLARMKA